MKPSEIVQGWCKKNNLPCFYFEKTKSTNDEAKTKLSTEELDFTIYVAREQTHGRGRGENHWYQPGIEASILTSWVTPLPHAAQPTASPIIGLALYKASQTTWPLLDFKIKPPNDLLIGNKKTAGLLIEAVQQGNNNYLVIGLGFNLLAHPKEIDTATSIYEHEPAHYQVLNLEPELLSFLDHFYTELKFHIKDLTQPLLSEQLCSAICQAIGAVEVTPNCDIITNEKHLSWRDL